jgi:hypothetical protein
MKGQYIYFRDMPLRTLFVLNGNRCQKVSTRTARLLDYNRTFYFGQRELCIVGHHDRIEL